MNWFRRLFSLPAQPPIPAVPKGGIATEVCESEWRAALEVTRVSAYKAGLAQGELNGRMLLANEIEAEFATNAITEADAQRIRHRQVH